MAAGKILNFKSKIKFDARNDLSDTEICENNVSHNCHQFSSA